MAAKVFTFSGVLWTDRNNPYPIPQEYAALYPASTPFLSSAMARYNPNSVLLPSPDFKFFEHRAGWREQYLDNNNDTTAWSDPGAGVGTPGATAVITVDGATGVTVDASLLNTVVEIWDSAGTTYKGVAVVTVVTNTTTITLTAIGNPESSTETMGVNADNDRFYVISTAFGEEVDAPEAASDELEVVWNSCQLHRTTLEIGKTLQQAALRGESDELARLRGVKGNEHKIKMGRGFYFGYRPGGIGGTAWGADSSGSTSDTTFVNHVTDVNSKTIRTSMGIFAAVRRYGRRSGDKQSFFNIAQANFSYNDWVEISDKESQYNPDGSMKEWYVGPGFMNFLMKIGAEGLLTKNTNSRVNISLSDTETSSMGLNYRILETPRGPRRIIEDQLLRYGNYSNHALCVHPPSVQLVKYEEDMYLPNIKTDNNPRVQKDEISSFCGIKMGLVETNTMIQIT